MSETIKELDARIEDLQKEKRERRAVEHQQVVLLPQLARKRTRLDAGLKRIGVELAEVVAAIGDVENGRLTDYCVRRPRQKKPTAPA